MSVPKISLITVVYNAVATLPDTIRSVQQQDYSEIEYLVIDGGSSDGSADVIQAHQDVIDYWVSEPDRGIYDAMNKGLHRATGEIIGFLNADDVFAHDHVLSDVAEALSKEEIDLCFSDLVYVDQFNPDKEVRYWKSSAYEGARQFLYGWVPPHPTLYAKRRVYEQIGGFNLDYPLAADFDILARMFLKHSFRHRYVPDVWVRMRLGGATNQSFGNVWKQNREIRSALLSCGLKPGMMFLPRKVLSRLKQFGRKQAG